MPRTAAELGSFVRLTRKELGLTQEAVALAAGTGLTFLIDLEKGKPTCELQKVLDVLYALGVMVTLTSPVSQ